MWIITPVSARFFIGELIDVLGLTKAVDYAGNSVPDMPSRVEVILLRNPLNAARHTELRHQGQGQHCITRTLVALLLEGAQRQRAAAFHDRGTEIRVKHDIDVPVLHVLIQCQNTCRDVECGLIATLRVFDLFGTILPTLGNCAVAGAMANMQLFFGETAVDL